MASEYKDRGDSKSKLHPRSLHRKPYDFAKLKAAYPELSRFVRPNPFGNQSVDFANPDAVKALNTALLAHFYKVKNWNIPTGYLCPPIPGRADYLHYVADLLMDANNGIVPKGNSVSCLDIGSGANCIYPLIGHAAYGWSFVGSDVDPFAIQWAKRLLASNPSFEENIQLRLQEDGNHIFKGLVKPKDRFDLVICNPPFHGSLAEAKAAARKKTQNLGTHKGGKTVLNFGGKASELWCDGGEKAFIQNMIAESLKFKNQCLWFTSLVAKSSHLNGLRASLKKANAVEAKVVEMGQGNKISRILTWTFHAKKERKQWAVTHWKK